MYTEEVVLPCDVMLVGFNPCNYLSVRIALERELGKNHPEEKWHLYVALQGSSEDAAHSIRRAKRLDILLFSNEVGDSQKEVEKSIGRLCEALKSRPKAVPVAFAHPYSGYSQYFKANGVMAYCSEPWQVIACAARNRARGWLEPIVRAIYDESGQSR